MMAAVTVAVGTGPPGPGLDPDAQSYIGAAASLARSGSYRVPTSSWTVADTTEPLTHFPPGFPTVIAAPIVLGVSPAQAGRLIVVLAAFVTWTGLVVLITGVATLRTGALVGLAALGTPAILNVHLSVLSEPPFLSALVVALAGMWGIYRSPQRWPALWTGLAVAAAVMLRYAGLSLVVAALWWVVLGPGRRQLSVWGRIQRAGLVAAPSAVLLAAWLLRSIRLGGTNGIRTLGTYGAFGVAARQGLETLVSWAAPVGTGWWRFLFLAVAMASVAGMTRVIRASVHDAPATAPEPSGDVSGPRSTIAFLLLGAGVAVVYVGFVIASRLVADPNIPFDERMLSPLLLLAEIEIGVLIAAWRGRDNLTRAVIACVLVAWFVCSTFVSVSRIVVAREDGDDFAGSDWRDSPTIAWVRSSAGGANRALYTNWPAAVYFQAHRASHDLPTSLNGLALHRFRERLARSHGVVVGFAARSPDVAPPDSVALLMGLHEIARFGDGAVWELQEPPGRREAGTKKGRDEEKPG